MTREGGHSHRRIVPPEVTPPGRGARVLDNAAAALDIRTGHTAVQVLHDDAAVTGCRCSIPTDSASCTRRR
ncbi:L-aspartate oxidase domain protein [Mycobacterium xenopi 4042]|uniref:L-aspartate oxidase domain protein n=1 Tax=Mycobacterium xenopi 4042 TaxID=1299334 RepID=X8DLX2_MYCXE|nr:L-aspartate oxidase domain protein [Mycobacterium xenopi 4042]